MSEPGRFAAPEVAVLRDAAVSLSLDAATGQVIGALKDASVRTLLLKGPAIAMWLYGSGEPRGYCDLDLLVPVEDRQSARKVLAAIGFTSPHRGCRRDEASAHAEEWVRSDGLEVDLHFTLPLTDVPPQSVWRALVRDQVALTVHKADVQVPSESARALIVAIQVVHDGVTDRRVEELSRAVANIPEETWRRAVALAAELAVDDVLAVALKFSSEGQALADRLGLRRVASVRTRILTDAPSPEVRSSALRWMELCNTAGVVAKVRFVLRRVVPSRSFLAMHAGVDSPTVGQLARAYVRRGKRAARYGVAGCRTWREAEERARLSRRSP